MSEEKGLTLVEVLAAIVLLAVVFISVFGFFANSFQFNSINNESIQGMNIAREQRALIQDLTLPDLKSEYTLVNGNYQKTFNKNEYEITILIKAAPESGNFYQELHQVHIEVRTKGRKVSETFTYYEGNVVSTP